MSCSFLFLYSLFIIFFRKLYQLLLLLQIQTKIKKEIYQKLLHINIIIIINRLIELIIQIVLFIVTHLVVIQIHFFRRHATEEEAAAEGNIKAEHRLPLYHYPQIQLNIVVKNTKHNN